MLKEFNFNAFFFEEIFEFHLYLMAQVSREGRRVVAEVFSPSGVLTLLVFLFTSLVIEIKFLVSNPILLLNTWL